MTSDPQKPLLRVSPNPQLGVRVGKQKKLPQPDEFTLARQREAIAPKFARLAEALARDPGGLSLRSDPSALAPERLLVFEIRASISAFIAAVRKVPGLEFVDEEELPSDELDNRPVAYLLLPSMQALSNLQSLWARWLRGEDLGKGFAPWKGVFSHLRDLRTWGPSDRVDPSDRESIREELEEVSPLSRIRLELELIYRVNEQKSQQAAAEVARLVADRGGTVISFSRIDAISYHALLVDLPAIEVRGIVDLSGASIAGVDEIMYVRPQSIASSLAVTDYVASLPPIRPQVLGEPILALLDGVPVAAHSLLRDHISLHDLHGIEPSSLVGTRRHGTAMASLVVHGDRSVASPPLPRKIHLVPVIASDDQGHEGFPKDKLIVDVIYTSIISMRDGAEPTAPNVIIVNISLGNSRKRFHNHISAWARLLDYLAYKYGLLFIVSAGNCSSPIISDQFSSRTHFEDCDPTVRASAVIKAIGARMAERRIMSPSESVNAVTVGAANQDEIPDAHRRAASALIDPYTDILIANPSSSLGPGLGNSVKPEILMPGSRERLSVVRTGDGYIELSPSSPGRVSGIKVAAPGADNLEGFTSGTSAAAAIASRTCHRIHDALEKAYGRDFIDLRPAERAALLKALLCHNARWPSDTCNLIVETLGPASSKQHTKRKDNIRRFLGYGVVDQEDAIACADDRATFWATGQIRENDVITVPIPVPQVISGLTLPHEIIATVAWITPTRPGIGAYRSVRLGLLEPSVDSLGVAGSSEQPDRNQIRRGTVICRRWEGSKAAAVTGAMSLQLNVQREPDQGSIPVDEAIPFGVAVTISMPGVTGLYAEVAQRLNIQSRAQI